LTHTQAELLEISLVAVPANREAVRIRSAEEGDEPEEIDVDDLVGNNSGAIGAKAGRVISSANLEKLRSAIDAIQAVIDAAGMEEPVVKPMAEPEPEEYKADAGVLNALTRFVGGYNGQ
jgi:hypothetical protein